MIYFQNRLIKLDFKKIKNRFLKNETQLKALKKNKTFIINKFHK